MRIRIHVTLAALALVVAPLSFAANYGFMMDTPVSKFNDQDMKLFGAAIDRALAAQEMDKPIEWSNEKTGSGGSVTPKTSDKPDCRTLQIATHHKTMKAESERLVCKVQGKWKAVS
jgi:surface antigen